MSETEEEPQGRLAGMVKSFFGKRKADFQHPPPPVLAQPDRNLEELSLIKQKVQGVSQPILEKKPLADLQAQPFLHPAKTDSAPNSASFLPSSSSAPAAGPASGQAFEPQPTPHEIAAPSSQTQPSDASATARHAPARKSKLDEIRDNIEESVKRKNPAHLKKNIEEVNEHFRYVKRKSALSEKKIEKIVDAKVREELSHMGASIKARINSNPPQAEKEQLEGLQKKLLELMDISDKKSEIEIEQLGSQMDGLRKQISSIPDILVQKEIDELSPLKEEVLVLRGELRKALPNVSDADERTKLEGTLARVEALSKVFEQNPGQDALRSELEEMRAQLGSISSAIEKSRIFEAGIDAKSALEFNSLKEEMEALKAKMQALPAAVEAAESKGMASIRNNVSDMRSSVQQIADGEKKLDGVSAQMDTLQRRIDSLSRRVGSVLPEDFGSLRDELRSMRSSIRSILSSSRGKEEHDLTESLQKELNQILTKGEAHSAAEFNRLERNLSDVKKQISTLPSKIDDEKPELDALKKELQSLKSAVSTALSQPKSEEEAKMLQELQSHLDGLLEERESRSLKEFGALRGELADVRRKVVGIPLRVEAGSRPEFDAVRSEVLSLQKLVSDALSRPRDEDEKRLLLGLRSRLEGLLEAGESRSLKEMEKLEGEISDVRAGVSRIPGIVGARERPELDAIHDEVVGLQRMVSVELSKPRNQEEKHLLEGLQSRLENLMAVSESRIAAEFSDLRKELSDVRAGVSRIPGIVGARERPELDAIHAEIVGMHKAVSDALSRPKDEDEKRLLLGLRSRLEGLLEAGASHSASEFSRIDSELSEIRNSISRIPSIVGARERYEFDTVKAELIGLKTAVSDALSRPLDQYQKNILQGLLSRLEGLMSASESRSVTELGKVEGELSEIRERISRMPGMLFSQEKADTGLIQAQIDSLKKVVAEALSKPRDDGERRFLKGLESRLEGLLAVSEENSTQNISELRKEIGAVRKNLSAIPSSVEAGEKPEIDSLRGEVQSIRSVVESALAQPKNEDEKEMLRNILAQLDSMVKYFDLKAKSVIENMKAELVSTVSAEKPELESLKEDVEKALSKQGNAAIEHELRSIQNQIAAFSGREQTKTAKGGNLSDIRENIAALKNLLEKRNHAGSVAVQMKMARKQKERNGKKKHKKSRPPIKISSGTTGKRKPPIRHRPRAITPKKLPRYTASRALSGLKGSLETRSLSRRGRSDINSFIAQIKKKQKSKPKALPAIERRLGGRYSTSGNPKLRIGDIGLDVPHNGERPIRSEPDDGPERRSAGLEQAPIRAVLDELRDLPKGGSDERRDFLRRDAPKGGTDSQRETLRRSIEQDEKELAEAERREAAPEKQGGYESYLQKEKMGRISSDVKRMHDRLKDIRRRYKEEF